MAEISKIQLPSGNIYDLKDETARSMISGGISFNIVWTATNYAQTSAPSSSVLADIPKDVVVYYNSGASSATGTLIASSSTKGKFYLIYSKTQAGTLDMFDEYATIDKGSSTYAWEKIGDTLIDLSNVVTDVTLNKQTDKALGESTTFALTSGAVTHGTPTTDKVLGESTTFTLNEPTITVTPTTTNIKATASGAAVGADGTVSAITGFGAHSTDTFVKSVTATSNKKLVTTSIPNVTGNASVTIPNVTSVGAAASWSFAMGSGTASETLIITGGNGSAPTLGTSLNATNVTLGTAIIAATGAVATDGAGASLVTDISIGSSASAITALGTATTSTVLTGVKVTSQPTIALATGATAGTGVISVATGISSATATNGSISVGTNDKVSAITAMPTSTVGTGITVGTNDKVTVLTDSTTLSVTKGT